MTKHEVISAIENQEKARYPRLPIKSYGFYIARQGYYDLDGRYFEVCAILNINIPSIQIENHTISKIEITFQSAGGRKSKASYSSGMLHLNMEERDLVYWLTGLQNPYTYIDLSSLDPEYVNIFLYSGKLEA